jgi:predicted dehydrogenase
MGVIGYGYWGSKHVRVLSSLPEVNVTVIDPVAERLAEAASFYPAARFAHSLKEALDDVDAVVVAAPPAEHFELTSLAVEAGKHALVEKPLTTSVEDAELLVEAASHSGAMLMAGHTFEYNPAVWKLKEIIQSGFLGRILYIDAQRLSLGRYQRDVNVVWDLAPHDISIVSYLLDDIPSAATVWADRNIGVRHADVAYVRLDFERAATHAFIHVSWLNPKKVREVTVVGERKMAVYDDLSDNERIRIYDIGVDPREIEESGATHAMPVSYRTGDIISPYIAFNEPLLLQDKHFVQCARMGQQPNTPGQRGLDIVRVLAATDIALATGRRASIHHDPRRASVRLPTADAATVSEQHSA